MRLDSFVFPAYAGMNRNTLDLYAFVKGVPRLRGDEPSPAETCEQSSVCSPPTRG